MRSSEPSDASGPEATAATYAVVRHGGHQYRVAAGERLLVDRLSSDVGTVVGLEPVLLLADGDGVKVGGAALDGVRIAATVAGHRRGRKLRIFTFKPKKRHRRTLGFRAELTELVIDRVLARGEPLPEPVVAEEPDGETVEPDVTAEPDAVVAPRRRRRAAPRATAAAAPEETEEATASTEVVEAETETEPEAPAPRSRFRKPRAAPAQAAEATAVAGDAEIPPSRPAARRSRPRAAAPEAEPASPKNAADAVAESEPSPAEAPAAKPRRVGRRTKPPEAAE